MNLQASLASGKEGMEFTIISVVGTLLIGWLIGRKFLKVDRDTSYLISSGTAICGGSAIAAVGPVLKAKDSEMSVALGTIFILNAIALFVFPMIGHALNMSQHEFGTWAAIAIHEMCIRDRSHFRQINADDFHIYVSYEELLRLGSDKYTVKIKNLPKGVSQVRFNPAQVDFLIEQVSPDYGD